MDHGKVAETAKTATVAKNAPEPDRDAADRDLRPKGSRSALSWKKRIGLVTFGVIVSAVALESILRLTGFVYHFERMHKPGDYADDAFVILCVGDSCTYGEGANPKTQSYPVQLENILRARHPERNFRTVNLGLPGMNSSQLARRFEGYVQLHNPDLAIILIGNNDVWNQNDSFIYLVGKGDDVAFPKKARAWLRSWCDSLRVVRLARVIALNIDDDRDEHRRPEGDPRRRDDHYNPMRNMSPSARKFKRGEDILGGLANVGDLYRFNFSRMTKVAERKGVEMLWLDYHLDARFGDTKYIAPLLDELGASFIDLSPYFHTRAKGKGASRRDELVRMKLISGDRWHPNELGYAVFARVIYNKIVAMGHCDGPPIPVLEDIRAHD